MYLTKTLSMKQNTLKKDMRDFDICVLVYIYRENIGCPRFSHIVFIILIIVIQIYKQV